jgi:hypothetical protein
MNLLQEVNSLFKRHNVSLKAEEKTVIELSAEAVLEDGTSIYTDADAWAEKVNVYTKDADGNPVPLPSGDYTLADGTVLTVTDGVLDAIVPAEDMSAELNSTKEELASVQEHLAKMIELVKSLETQLSAQKETNVKLSSEVTKLKKQPATNSVKENFNRAKATEQKAEKPFHAMNYQERFAHNLTKFNK